jgi:hypothetical protein
MGRTGHAKIRGALRTAGRAGITPGVLAVLSGIIVTYAVMAAVGNAVPEPALRSLALLLGLPPALVLFYVGAFLGVPVQQFSDAFFLFVAVPYWLALSYLAACAYKKIKKAVAADRRRRHSARKRLSVS